MICLLTPSKAESEANAVFLCGSYAILGLDLTADNVYSSLSCRSTFVYMPFRDAGYGRFQIGILDCLKAVQRAAEEKLLNFDKFDVQGKNFFPVECSRMLINVSWL